MYTPDKWIVIKIGEDKPLYKVFGTWFGGYSGDDRWRINSGITSVEASEKHFDFIGATGSIYRCIRDMYGVNNYTRGILINIMKDAKDAGVPIEIMDRDTDWSELEYVS